MQTETNSSATIEHASGSIEHASIEYVSSSFNKRIRERFWLKEETMDNLIDTISNDIQYESQGIEHGESIASSIYLDSVDLVNYYAMFKYPESAKCYKIVWSGIEPASTATVVEYGTMKNIQCAPRAFQIEIGDILPFLNNSPQGEGVKREIQRAVVQNRMRPMIRVVSARKEWHDRARSLKITLESDIQMNRECSDFEQLSGIFPLTRWYRPEINFRKDAKDSAGFPYILLTVEYLESRPLWLENLVFRYSPRIVNDFSKATHAVSILFHSATIHPYWHAYILEDARGIQDGRAALGELENSEVDSPNLQLDGRKVFVPVRVEPKVFFANERTFLSWVQFSIFLGGIGTAMMGMGDGHAAFCGIVLIIAASIFSLYSLYLFYWRALKIRAKDPGPYDDNYGPFVLVFVFLVAISLCCFFKIPLKNSIKIN